MMKIPEGKYKDLMNTPFRFGGRGRHCVCGREYADSDAAVCSLCRAKLVGTSFYDCYGLAMEVCRRNDVELPAHTSVCEPRLTFEAIERGKSDFLELDKPEPFCLVVLDIKAPYQTHIGVVLEDPAWFIHIMPKRSVGIKRLRKWERRVDGYFRYIGG